MACELQQEEFVVVNMNKRSNKIYPFDLLVNGYARIDVKTSMSYQGYWKFALSQSQDTGIIESDNYLKLGNGRLRKKFNKACDFLILCGIHENKQQLFVIPANVISETIQTISIPQSGNGKWWKWHNRFDLIREVIAKKPKLTE